VSEDLEVDKQSSRRLYEEVFGRGNYAVADEILTADVISHGPGVSPVVGTDPIKRQAALLRSAFPDLQVVLGDQLAEGDRVSTRWSASGTHTGPLNLPTGAVEPSGTTIAFDEIRIDRYVGGRIVEAWFLPDRMTLWRQLGLVPAPPAPSPRSGEIHHFGLTVRDVDVSAKWYVEHLGFQKVGEFESPDGARRKVFLRHDGLRARLGLTEHRSGNQDVFDETRVGLDHMAFAVEDHTELAAWVTRLTAARVVHSPIAPANSIPGAAVLVFRDPDNIQLEFFLDPSRGSA
jgi:glyoxylase I family protein